MSIRKTRTHLVLKWEDISKYLSPEQKAQLQDIRTTITNGRVIDGKRPINQYYICNKDEPYADKVLKTILNGEDAKVIWYCNDVDCWRDELSKEDLKSCAFKGKCELCEHSSGYRGKAERDAD